MSGTRRCSKHLLRGKLMPKDSEVRERSLLWRLQKHTLARGDGQIIHQYTLLYIRHSDQK